MPSEAFTFFLLSTFSFITSPLYSLPTAAN